MSCYIRQSCRAWSILQLCRRWFLFISYQLHTMLCERLLLFIYLVLKIRRKRTVAMRHYLRLQWHITKAKITLWYGMLRLLSNFVNSFDRAKTFFCIHWKCIVNIFWMVEIFLFDWVTFYKNMFFSQSVNCIFRTIFDCKKALFAKSCV